MPAKTLTDLFPNMSASCKAANGLAGESVVRAGVKFPVVPAEGALKMAEPKVEGLPEKVSIKSTPRVEGERLFFKVVVPGRPMGKPRMTQRDKWAKRPAVLRYRDWCDGARAATGEGLPVKPYLVNWRAFIPMPGSWSKKKRVEMVGRLHQQRPDRDNIDKAVLDALWGEDSCVAAGSIEKVWCWEGEERLELEVWG